MGTPTGEDVGLLEVVRRAQSEFIRGAPAEIVFGALLGAGLERTRSPVGLVAQLDRSPEGALAIVPFAERSTETSAESVRALREAVETALHGPLVTSGEPFFANALRAPLTRACGLPLRHDGEVLGVLALANGAEEYTQLLRELLAPLLAAATELLAAQRQRVEHARYRALLEWSNELAIVTDRECRVVYASPAYGRVLGRDAAPGERVAEVHPEDARVLDELFAESLRRPAERVVGRTVRLKSSAGEWVELDGAFTNLTEDPAVRGVLAHARDVRERTRGEQERAKLRAQVQHAQKLESLGVLAGGIAHDFNNLLVAILGNITLARLELGEQNAPAHALLDDAETASQRAAELCRQMLAYSGRGRFVVEPIDVSSIVEEMSNLLSISISKKVVLKLALARGLPTIEAEATQLRQIVMNLLTNASEAIGDASGLVTVTTGALECDREYLRESYLDDDLVEGVYTYIEVADTGVGMDAATREKIFDPFFTTKFTGRGLGLASVLGIVRGHRGAIKVYSEPGRGTTFKVLFPATNRPSVEVAAPVGTELPKESGLVLVVDDEETVRATARRLLERAGFTVITTSDGRAALPIFAERQREIDVVLLDMTMPHLDGSETFRELRRIRADVRVVLTSGYSEQEAVSRFAGKGLAGFVQKPYRMQELVAVIRAALGG